MFRLQRNVLKLLSFFALCVHLFSFASPMISLTCAGVRLIEEQAEQWVKDYITMLNPQEIQVIINALCFASSGITLKLTTQELSRSILDQAFVGYYENNKINYVQYINTLRALENYSRALQDAYDSSESCFNYIENLQNNDSEKASYAKIIAAINASGEYERFMMHTIFKDHEDEYQSLLEEMYNIHLDTSKIISQSATICRKICKKEIERSKDIVVDLCLGTHENTSEKMLDGVWQTFEANQKLLRFFEAFQEMERVFCVIYYEALVQWVEGAELFDICAVRMFDKDGIIDKDYQFERLPHSHGITYTLTMQSIARSNFYAMPQE